MGADGIQVRTVKELADYHKASLNDFWTLGNLERSQLSWQTLSQFSRRVTLETTGSSVSLQGLVKGPCREAWTIKGLANSSSTKINKHTSSPRGSFGHHKHNKEIKPLESVQRRATKMVTAPRLSELKEHLANTLRHILWFSELSCDRPRVVFWQYSGSFQTRDILWFYSIILNYFLYTILGSRSGLNTQVIHNEAVMESIN